MWLFVVALVLFRWQATVIARTSRPERRQGGRRFRPFQYLLAALTWVAPGAKPRVQKVFIRTGYHLLSARNRDRGSTFMNYGYAPLDQSDLGPALEAEDEADLYSIQLYYRVAAAVDLREKDVLEVGCGRGGGSSFIKRYLHPATVTGIDIAGEAIRFCQRRYQIDGLTFRQGDAERLPCPAEAFDIVVNVESSHCYPSVERFFAEVHRVLRPGGYFLFADMRWRKDSDLVLQQFHQAGLTLLLQEQITANVVHALELDSERRQSLIRHNIPAFLRKVSQEFYGVKGSQFYEVLNSRELEYLCFVLSKPEHESAALDESSV